MTKAKIIGIAILSTVLYGCGVNTSGNIDVNPNNLRYFYDSRTDLCFAAVASRKTANFDTTGLGLTNVPCSEEVRSLIK